MSANSGNIKRTSRKISAICWSAGEKSGEDVCVPVERAVALTVDGKGLATLHCSPDNLEDLARGFLLGQGLLSSASDIAGVKVSVVRDEIDVILDDSVSLDPEGKAQNTLYSGCGQGMGSGAAVVESLPEAAEGSDWSAEGLLGALRRVLDRGQAYRITRGMHSAGLVNRQGRLLCHREDIGRHNALDKVLGWLSRQCLEPGSTAVAMSGRVSVDAVLKAARFRMPVVFSKGVPTSMALDEAETLGLTLASSIGRRRLRVYTHGERLGP